MKVKDIQIYYLNPDWEAFAGRRKRMDEFLTSLGMPFERFPSNEDRYIRPTNINMGYMNLIKRAIEVGKYPFLLLEDDAALIKLPEDITIPPEAKIIYWGGSTWECGGIKPPMKIQEYDENYYRLIGSLGTHAMLIPNKESAEHYAKITQSAIDKGDYADIFRNRLSIKPLSNSKGWYVLLPERCSYRAYNQIHLGTC